MKKKRMVSFPCHGERKKLYRIMKLTVFFSALFVFQAMGYNSYTQSTRLNLNLKEVTLKQVFEEIEKQSEFVFLYDSYVVSGQEQVTVNFSDATVTQILDQVLNKEKVDYLIRDRQIIIKEKSKNPDVEETPESSDTPAEQAQVVSGKVHDKEGVPIPGVNIIIQGTTQGTVTDDDGSFRLEVSSYDVVLQASFIGYISQTIPLNGRSSIEITLDLEVFGLQEVVAVGYGTQKKVNLTGAVSVLSSDALEDRPISTTAQGLQGLIPNLNINFDSGDPSASGVDYNIRGFESINGGSPYILVDGVPMGIEDINPNDIESISVLKDASASAIYGGKAAFGVILVTTKKSKGKDKITVNYSNETALSKPIFRGYEPVDNSYDFVTYRNLMETNEGLTPRYLDEHVAGVLAYYENPESAPRYGIVNNEFRYYGYNNYQDLLLRDVSPSYKHNLSIAGGTQKSNYYFSFGSFTKEGILKVGNDVYTRNNVLFKLNQEIADWISIDQKVAVNFIKSDKPHDYGRNNLQVSGILLNQPILPVKFPEGDSEFPELGGIYFDNIIGYLDEGSRTVQRAYDTWLSAGVNLKPVKNLNIRGEFSYNYRNSVKEDAVATIQFAKTEGLGQGNNFWESYTSPSWARSSTNYSRGYVFNTYAEYELNDLGAHYIKAMAGFNEEEKYFSNVSAIGYDLITPSVLSVGAAIGDHVGSAGASHYALRGGFYRLNYIYDDKYLVELSGRYDGTSRFPKDDRFGFFPSGSLGWRISEEGFMRSLEFVDNLKLRASYGELGNQQITYQGESLLYPYISSLGIGTSTFLVLDESNSYPTFTTMPELISNTLTWETVATTNFGLDLTLLDQRLDGSFDYYIRETRDMLMQKDYPEIIGAQSPFVNGADLETKGWELTVSWRDIINDDFSYNVRFSLWDSKTTITKFDNPTNTLSTYYEGQEIGEIWGYETIGLFEDQEEIDNAADQSQFDNKWYPGDVHYKDQLTVDTNDDGIPDETDGVINSGEYTLDDHGDMIVIGNKTPRYSYSLNLGLNYKSWSFMAFFQGVGKRDHYPNTNFMGWWPWSLNGTIQKTDITDSWTEDNKDAYWFRASSDASKNKSAQTRWLQDASYFRLKSLVINYSLPSGLISKVGLTKAEIFISGQNLWEHSNFIYKRDPEQNTGNIYDINSQMFGPNKISYPTQRTFSAGVNLTF